MRIRTLQRVFTLLAALVICGGVALLYERFPSARGAGVPDTEQSLPRPRNQAAGPYLPWPLSFPKLLPGLFMLDAEAPNLRVTRQQAEQLLPLVERMGTAWNQVHATEIKIKHALDDRQRTWITQMKHGLELSTVIDRVMQACGSVPPGENASVRMALRICDRRMPHPLPADLAAEAEAVRRAQPADAEYETRPGQEWLTVFDETTALYLIEEDHPDLRLQPRQAAIIHAILEDVVEPLKTVALNESRLRRYLTEAQIHYVQTHMESLYHYRTGRDLGFPGNPAATDPRKYHDPLYYETEQFLKRVASR